MPRKFNIRVTLANMHLNISILAPLPVDESDVESPVEHVPSTKAELAEPNDESADATMKDKEDEEEEDDDDDNEDPETSV